MKKQCEDRHLRLIDIFFFRERMGVKEKILYGSSLLHLIPRQVEKGAKKPSLSLILKIADSCDVDPGILLARKDSLIALKNLLSKNGIPELIKQLQKEASSKKRLNRFKK